MNLTIIEVNLQADPSVRRESCYRVPSFIPCPHCGASLVVSMVCFGELATGGTIECSECHRDICRDQIHGYFVREGE